ncbi:MAG: hypothetical protein LBF40_02795, partial [Deltaproteobacteria bacterium]|nr:hypothetical protein [Deltaproteobacteria bacterium]
KGWGYSKDIIFSISIPPGFEGEDNSLFQSRFFSNVSGFPEPDDRVSYVTVSTFRVAGIEMWMIYKDTKGRWLENLVRMNFEEIKSHIDGLQSSSISYFKGNPMLSVRAKRKARFNNRNFADFAGRVVMVDEGLIQLECGTVFDQYLGAMDKHYESVVCEGFFDSLVAQ